MLSGEELGIFAAILKTDGNGLAAYQEMAKSAELQRPLSHPELRAERFDGLILPDGHAKSVRPYLESTLLQSIVTSFSTANKPIGVICHDVLLPSAPPGLVLYGKEPPLSPSSWN